MPCCATYICFVKNTLIIMHYVQVINEEVCGHEATFSANDLISTDYRKIKMIAAAPEWGSQCQHKTYQK